MRLNRFARRILALITTAGLIGTLLLAGGASVAVAAPGDSLRQINGAYSQGSCGINTGLAFDGTNLLITCWDYPVIDLVSPADGSLQGSVTIAGYGGLQAIAWDASRNKLWTCADHSSVILVDMATGTSTPMFGGYMCTDGLAYDGTDDTLWISGDVSNTLYHVKTDGTLIEALVMSGLIGSCGNSGIAVGGDKLYLANNGCSEIYEADKDLSSSVLFASFPARLEDLECDDITFKAAGVGAIWSGDAYDRILNAWEIPAGKCGFGGGGGGGGSTKVTIDIKPNSDPSSFGCKSKGSIPVAIVGSADLDVTQVDANSVLFGKTGNETAEVHRDKNGDAQKHIEDYNGDGIMDLILHFDFTQTGFSCADIQPGQKSLDTVGKLSGKLADGTAIAGESDLRLVR